MEFKHMVDGSNEIHIYKRKYIGGGRYYVRGICKGIKEGDTMVDRWNYVFNVDKIISIKDSKGVFENPDNAKDALFEVEMVDPNYNPNIKEAEQIKMSIG